MKIAIVDHVGNKGGVSRVVRKLIPELAKIEPKNSITYLGSALSINREDFFKDFKKFIELLNDNNTTIDVDTKKQSLSFDFINNKKTVLEVNIPFTFNKNGTWFLDKKYKNTDNKFYHEKEGIYLSYGDRRPNKCREFATSTNTWINFSKILTQVRSKKL